jgi:hypothetical protein
MTRDKEWKIKANDSFKVKQNCSPKNDELWDMCITKLL